MGRSKRSIGLRSPCMSHAGIRLALVTIAIVLLIAGCSSSERDLVGEWRGIGADGQRFVLTLNSDKSVRMITGNQAVEESMYPDMQYRWSADDSHTPHRLTLTAKDKTNELTIPVIYKLLDRNTLTIVFGVTPRGEPMEWDQIVWNDGSRNGGQIVLERYTRQD